MNLTDIEGILGVALGFAAIVVALVFPIAIEVWRRPDLDIEVLQEPVPSNARFHFLHCRVVNRPHRFIAVERSVAVNARIQMRFLGQNGNLLSPAIEGKWDDGPECISPVVQIVNNPQNSTVQTTFAFNDAMIPFAHRWDVLPEVASTFAVVIKLANQSECYGFNGWSYQFPNFANQDWRIGTGTFRVEITVFSGRSRKSRHFELRNNGPNFADMTLRKIDEKDMASADNSGVETAGVAETTTPPVTANKLPNEKEVPLKSDDNYEFLSKKIEGALSRSADLNPIGIAAGGILGLASLAVALGALWFVLSAKPSFTVNIAYNATTSTFRQLPTGTGSFFDLTPYFFLVAALILIIIFIVTLFVFRKIRDNKVDHLRYLQTQIYFGQANLSLPESKVNELVRILNKIEAEQSYRKSPYKAKTNEFLEKIRRPPFEG